MPVCPGGGRSTVAFSSFSHAAGCRYPRELLTERRIMRGFPPGFAYLPSTFTDLLWMTSTLDHRLCSIGEMVDDDISDNEVDVVPFYWMHIFMASFGSIVFLFVHHSALPRVLARVRCRPLSALCGVRSGSCLFCGGGYRIYFAWRI